MAGDGLSGTRGPPGLGFVFTDGAAGSEIFSGWQSMLGTSDSDELIRVAIVEGQRPGDSPGYTVHVSLDFDRATALAMEGAAAGAPVDLDVRALEGDVAKRFPQRDPRPLDDFKHRFAAEGVCALVPVAFQDGQLTPFYPLAIFKRVLQLRQIEDIVDAEDPDFPLTQRE
jgi:hypothetical protein